MQANLPYGGWIRSDGELTAHELFTGIATIEFPDGACEAMPVPTGDLEAGYRATGAPNVVAYAVSAPTAESAHGSVAARSFGWARATSSSGAIATALLETGDSYDFTPAASVRAVEATLQGDVVGAITPAQAFGDDFILTIEDTSRSVHLG
jgi:hypothetical protein